MIYYIIGFFLFLTPLFVWQDWNDGIRSPKESVSIFGLMLIIAVSIGCYQLKPFKNKWLLAFWVWCFLTTLFSNYLVPVYLQKTIVDTPSVMFAWKELFYITLAVLSVWCISSVSPRAEKLGIILIEEKPLSYYIKLFAQIISACVIITCIYAVYQIIGLDEFFRCADPNSGFVAGSPLGDPTKVAIGTFTHRIVATMGNPKILATWIAMCLPFCLYLRGKLGYVAFILGIGIIAITKSSTAVLGLSVALFIYFFFTNRKILLSLCIVGAIVLSLGLFQYHSKINDYFNPRGRVEVHKEMFNILKEKSMTGLGLGTFEYIVGNDPKIVERLGNQNWKELHDEYGQIWFATGIVGLILFLCFIFSVIKKFLGRVTSESVVLMSSLAGYLVMCSLYFLMRVAPQSFYGVVLTGLLLNTIGDER